MIRVRDNDPEAARQVDSAVQRLVPACAPGTLPTDPKHLDVMFVLCTNNWRTYSGEKPKGDTLARLNAVHKQATLGDCTEVDWFTPFEKTVLRMWHSYKGTPKPMAKRRFLTLLREFDPSLLQIKAYHFAPWGFPRTAKGERICPYSNSKMGCPRPIMDKYGHNLEHELDHNESLADFAKLRKWLDEVANQQQCSLGLHSPIAAHMGANYSTFFARPECGGFQPYKSTGLHRMVKKVITKQLQALMEMQDNPLNFSRAAQVLQRDRFLGLQQYYTSITGQEVAAEVSCSRDSHHCNTRRIVEGSNHNHPIVIRAPPADTTLYDALIEVRRECIRLGVVPMTGPVESIDHRCRLLRMKVVDFHRKKMLVYESQRRQQWRTDIAPHDTLRLKAFATQHQSECLRQALTVTSMERVCAVVESGANPSTELRGGLFALLAAVLKRCVPDIKRLLAAGADIDAGNSRGMTSLMWAVKRDDYAMVDILLDEGADMAVEGCTGWTAMSIAARHGRKDITQLLVETLRRDKNAGEMNADRVLNHRSSVNAGLTPLAIAAIHRDEAMVRCLLRLGAKPGVKCHRGYRPGEHAAMAGWTVLGLWLQETRAFGANGVYTFADIKVENALRVAGVRMLDAIASGAMVEDHAKKFSSKDPSVKEEPEAAILKQPVSPEPPFVAHGHSGLCDATNLQLEHVRSTTVLTVKLLQEGHAAPNTETDRGHTALLSAAYRGIEECVRLLIQEGADPNYSNRNDRTALMAAAAAGHHKVVVLLLTHGANASWMDIDGKVAGAYALERGFHDLAELLAIAASRGQGAALDWELDRGRRAEEERQQQLTDELLKETGGGKSVFQEADLNDWIIRVTKPREAARLADMKETFRQGVVAPDISARKADTRPVLQHQIGERCPKCTLLVPCRHFISKEILLAHFPDGVPDWDWNKRGLNRRSNPRPLAKVKGKDGASEPRVKQSFAWWRALYQAHRDIPLPHRGPEAKC